MMNWKTISLKDLAGFLSEELRKKGIDVILVGGACVTIYSHNRYQSYDLDFVVYEDMKTTLDLFLALLASRRSFAALAAASALRHSAL